ncbi:hypothetical protein ACIBL3_16405 [Kribbella sp. NPDC050124]|uniref:hypothetical protein n=1 Tax=Kribbella sp. NPDC050124 TaxID=3364114 RepID=UPI0037A52BDD
MPRRLATVALITTVATLPACTTESPKPPPVIPTTSTTPSPVNPSQQAGDAAVTAYRRYIQVINGMTASGGTEVKNLPSVAAGVELRVSEIQAENYRGRKIKTIGLPDIIWAKPTKLGGATAGKFTTASVQACLDTSKTYAVDAAGKNIKPPGTPTRWLDNRDLQLVQGSWKVVRGLNQGAQC